MAAKVVLVTGAARRTGLALVTHYHDYGLNVFLHTRTAEEGQTLCREFNAKRADSAGNFACDLCDFEKLPQMIEECVAKFGRLDVLVNSAAAFQSQNIGSVTAEACVSQLSANLVAPLLLIQAAAPHLRLSHGAVLNFGDAYCTARPVKGYSLYSASKAGVEAVTKSLAVELAPDIRVNAIAPGVLDWPRDWASNDPRREVLAARIPLGRVATYEDLWAVARLLTLESEYLTGAVVPLDGGSAVC